MLFKSDLTRKTNAVAVFAEESAPDLTTGKVYADGVLLTWVAEQWSTSKLKPIEYVVKNMVL